MWAQSVIGQCLLFEVQKNTGFWRGKNWRKNKFFCDEKGQNFSRWESNGTVVKGKFLISKKTWFSLKRKKHTIFAFGECGGENHWARYWGLTYRPNVILRQT